MFQISIERAALLGQRDKLKQIKKKKSTAPFEFEGRFQTASDSSPTECLSLAVGFLVLAVVLSSEIFEGGKAIAARHVLLKLFL